MKFVGILYALWRWGRYYTVCAKLAEHHILPYIAATHIMYDVMLKVKQKFILHFIDIATACNIFF